MSVPEIQEAERAEKCQQRRQRAGHWREFVAPRLAVATFGPGLPTWTERKPSADLPEDLVYVDQLVPTYLIGARSVEGPRSTAAAFSFAPN